MKLTFASEEQLLEAAEAIEERRYHDAVTTIAEQALEFYPDDEGRQQDFVWGSVDGSGYVFYNRRMVEVLRFTEHVDAYEEAGADTHEGDVWDVVRVAAFYAMHADVLATLARLRDRPAKKKGRRR